MKLQLTLVAFVIQFAAKLAVSDSNHIAIQPLANEAPSSLTAQVNEIHFIEFKCLTFLGCLGHYSCSFWLAVKLEGLEIEVCLSEIVIYSFFLNMMGFSKEMVMELGFGKDYFMKQALYFSMVVEELLGVVQSHKLA